MPAQYCAPCAIASSAVSKNASQPPGHLKPRPPGATLADGPEARKAGARARARARARTTAAGIGDSNGAATRNDLDDSGRAKMLATLAPDEKPPAKRAAVAEGSEAKPASKANAVAPTKAFGAAAAAKSKAVSNAEAAGKGARQSPPPPGDT